MTQKITRKPKSKTAAPKRICRDKNQVLLDRISNMFRYVPAAEKEEQLAIIGRALAVLKFFNDRKRCISEAEAVHYYTREQLQRMLLMKDGKMEIN